MVAEAKALPLPGSNLRQILEGMTIMFNPAAAQGLNAIIQFNVDGKEPGNYYLEIDPRRCTFNKGLATNPTLVIKTPSEVWLQIISGQLDGRDALARKLFAIEGDGSLLLKIPDMFRPPADFSPRDITEPPRGKFFPDFNRSGNTIIEGELPGKRPAGPLSLSGFAYIGIYFTAWLWYSVLIDWGVDAWISSGIPLLIVTLIVVYRTIYNRPLWQEIAGLIFFALAFYLDQFSNSSLFVNWGSITSSFYLGALWLLSLFPQASMPYSAEYSKWGFKRPIWRMSRFVELNSSLTLVWGWNFVLAAIFGIIAKITSSPVSLIFAALRILLMVPAIWYMVVRIKGAQTANIKDVDKAISVARVWAYIGTILAVACVAFIFLVLGPQGIH